MIKKYGKSIDISAFKSSMSKVATLRPLIEQYEKEGSFVAKHALSTKITKCPVCSCSRKYHAGTIYHIGYNQCAKCGLMYVGRQLSAAASREYYRDNKCYAAVSYSDKRIYKYRAQQVSLPKVEFVQKFLSSGQRRWLDVGSGIGDIVYNLRKKRFAATGLELNKHAVKFAHNVFNLTLEQKTTFELLRERAEACFDVISYFGVIEHIPSPLEEIETAYKLLAPGGLLVLEVPNAQSFSVSSDMFFKKSVVRHCVPTLHLMLFTQKSLYALAKKFSLHPEAMWFLGLDFYNFLLHLGVMIPDFFNSSPCQFLWKNNNLIQKIFDTQEMSDDIIFIARKPR